MTEATTETKADASVPVSVAVSIVNYGTAELTLRAVQSVLDAPNAGLDVRVIVVENASPGDDAATLKAALTDPRVTLVISPDNLGFGRGNNLAFDAVQDAPPDFFFLLNPDAYLGNDAIAALVQACLDDPKIGVAGASIARPTAGPVTAAFRFPTAASLFADGVSFGPISRLFAASQVPLPPDHPAGRVDWVSGAAVMFRRQALAADGAFDPDFFLYMEEVELIWRLGQAGWHCVYVPDAQVLHDEGVATQVNSHEGVARPKPDYWYQSQRLYLAKTRRPFAAIGAATASAGGVMLGRIINRLRGRRGPGPYDSIRRYARLVIGPLVRSALKGGTP